MNYKEITIPVPWGQIAGKVTGDESNEIIVALPGFRDNANSFDQLIPKLPKSYYYVSIDLPSHGRSSHFSSTSAISYFDFTLSLKFVLDYFNRGKYILLCHSFGSQIGVLFAQAFPEYISKIVSLDTVYFPLVDPEMFITNLRDTINGLVKISKINHAEAPTYTFDEAVERLMNSRVVPISKEGAMKLMERSLKSAGDGTYTLTTAQHLKHLVRIPFSMQYVKEIFQYNPVRCPHLLIIASESQNFLRWFDEIVQEYKKNKQFEMHVVQGSHDVHLEHPDRLAPIITKFLTNTSSKL